MSRGVSCFSQVLISTLPSKSLNSTDFPLHSSSHYHAVSLSKGRFLYPYLPPSVFFPSLQKHSRIQIGKDMNELSGTVFLIFKIWITTMVKYMQWVKEPGILNQKLSAINAWVKFYHFYFTCILVIDRVETQYVLNCRAVKIKWSLVECVLTNTMISTPREGSEVCHTALNMAQP